MTHDELSSETENKLFDYYCEKSKRPGDYWWKEANRISGSADYQDSDAGEAPKGANW